MSRKSGKSAKQLKKELSAKQKEELFLKVLNAAVELDFKKGLMKWSISDLARTAKVTRSLIYYYFGSKKEEIVTEAVKTIGSFMFGLNEEKMKMWASGQVAESIATSRAAVTLHPEVVGFYFNHRIKQSYLETQLADLDRQFSVKLAKLYPNVSDANMKLIWAFCCGLVIAPGLSTEDVSSNSRMIHRVLELLRSPA